jgi:hypothetical protein
MAEIVTAHQPATVVAKGAEMKATASVSGALMEMLATVYVYILMAAIREAIQNGCDAARRAGLSFSEGVQVLLPTTANPVITVIDQGSGMTKAFMEAEDGYLSFGMSTKSGDNGSAGGLGVGRWAAYGYIRECYITTTHESDMVERTYFQYQNAEGSPAVSLASEVPGKTVGTRVVFPVKESDLTEAYRAVAWLKEVMQLTMGDSFSVDSPALLPKYLPPYSRVPLELGEVDPGLKGIVVHPMQGDALKYGRQGAQPGSLVVLTNHEAGVGGLPFHVQSPGDTYSVFSKGMVVDIPMSFSVPFMPSREELKYTDEVNALLRRIDEAAAKALLATTQALYDAEDLESKADLTRLVGASEAWHWFALAARDSKCPQYKDMEAVTGGRAWTGKITLRCPTDMGRDVRLKVWDSRFDSLREARTWGGKVSTKQGKDFHTVMFNPTTPYSLVVNDVDTNGQTRFRRWAAGQNGHFIFFTAKTPEQALEAMEGVNAIYGHALPVIKVSSMPEVERKVVGTTVVRTFARGGLTFYCRKAKKQESAVMSFTTEGAPTRLWLEKDGSQIAGFDTGVALGHLQSDWQGGLNEVLDAMKVDRLYLLTPKQAAELRAAQADLADVDRVELGDLAADGDEDASTSLANAKALDTWKTFDSAIVDIMQHPAVADVVSGKRATKLTQDSLLLGLCKALARAPRMELTGSPFDKAISPYIDVLSGKVHMVEDVSKQHEKLHQGLKKIGENLKVEDTDADDRKEMKRILSTLEEIGHINYQGAMDDLKARFPLLRALSVGVATAEPAVGEVVKALAALYR